MSEAPLYATVYAPRPDFPPGLRTCISNLLLLSLLSLDTGPDRPSRIKSSDSKVYAPRERARLDLGLPQVPRQSPTAGSEGGAFSDERGTPVARVPA